MVRVRAVRCAQDTAICCSAARRHRTRKQDTKDLRWHRFRAVLLINFDDEHQPRTFICTCVCVCGVWQSRYHIFPVHKGASGAWSVERGRNRGATPKRPIFVRRCGFWQKGNPPGIGEMHTMPEPALCVCVCVGKGSRVNKVSHSYEHSWKTL